MESEKHEGKKVVPLFPGKCSVKCPDPEFRPGPSALLSTRPDNVAGVKRKLRPILAAMNESPHSSEWYYSHCSGRQPRPSNYQIPSSSSSSTMKRKCFSVQPPSGSFSYRNCCTDENDLAFPSFLQPGTIFNYGNLQLLVKKEKLDDFGSDFSYKLHGGYSKLSKELTKGDQPMRLHGNLGEESSHSLAGNRASDQSIGDETNRSNIPHAQICPEFKSLHRSKTVADGNNCAVEDSARSSPRVGDCRKCAKIGGAMKMEETSDTCTEGSINVTPNEVARVIGPKLFLKAKKTMVHQKKIFSLQLFELHRLVSVQRHIARSPQILHENSFDLNTSSVKFPPINKLLYVASLDPSPAIAKAKAETLKSNLGMEFGTEALHGMLPLPTTDVEKGHLAQSKTTKSLPNPPSIPMDPKLAPWCLSVPTGNQWLVAVRSPSEGLIYKPYPRLYFPDAGFMAPIYGNCGPIGLSSLGGGASHSAPPSNEHGSGDFCSTELGHSYLQSYAISPSCPNPELKQVVSSVGAQAGELGKTSPAADSNSSIPCKLSSQESTPATDCGGNLHRSNGSEMQGITETSATERLEGDALSLFPTTPSLQAVRKEQRVHAIKAIPHNRKSASESLARILQSIQEERRKLK